MCNIGSGRIDEEVLVGTHGGDSSAVQDLGLFGWRTVDRVLFNVQRLETLMK
jgi:hypothetical protein